MKFLLCLLLVGGACAQGSWSWGKPAEETVSTESSVVRNESALRFLDDPTSETEDDSLNLSVVGISIYPFILAANQNNQFIEATSQYWNSCSAFLISDSVNQIHINITTANVQRV